MPYHDVISISLNDSGCLLPRLCNYGLESKKQQSRIEKSRICTLDFVLVHQTCTVLYRRNQGYLLRSPARDFNWGLTVRCFCYVLLNKSMGPEGSPYTPLNDPPGVVQHCSLDPPPLQLRIKMLTIDILGATRHFG